MNRAAQPLTIPAPVLRVPAWARWVRIRDWERAGTPADLLALDWIRGHTPHPEIPSLLWWNARLLDDGGDAALQDLRAFWILWLRLSHCAGPVLWDTASVSTITRLEGTLVKRWTPYDAAAVHTLPGVVLAVRAQRALRPLPDGSTPYPAVPLLTGFWRHLLAHCPAPSRLQWSWRQPPAP